MNNGPIMRRIPFTAVALAMIVLPLLVMALRHWHDIPLGPGGTATGIADPDPWLRLTLVRDWLMGGSWYDHSVARTNAPFGGITSPWTRPLDMVIALLVKLQPADVEITIRLVRAALLLPALWATLMMLGIYRATRALCPLPTTPLMANALALTGLSMWGYFAAGYADHHTPLATLFVWALGGLLADRNRRGPVMLSGMLLGIMLWMSPEALVLIGGIYGWYGVAFLRGKPGAARQLQALAWAVALTTTAALLVERPSAQWLTPVYDSMSIVYVFTTLLCALCASLLNAATRTALPTRLGLAAFGIAAVVGGIALAYPAFLHGPMVGVDPFILSDFLPRITEAKPLWSRPWLVVVAQLLQPLFALGLMLWASRGRDTIYPRETAAKLAFLLGLTVLLYLVQQRWYYYCYPLVVITLSPWLAALLNPEHMWAQEKWPARWIAGLTPTAQGLRRMPLILLLLSAQGALLLAAPDETTPHSKSIDACHKTARQIIHRGDLNALGNGKMLTILAPTDLGAEILFWSPHRIIASNYHREGPGIRYVWEADAITRFSTLRAYLSQRKVDALLVCPVAQAPTQSALQALQQETRTPPWLARVTLDITHPQPSDPAFFLLTPSAR